MTKEFVPNACLVSNSWVICYLLLVWWAYPVFCCPLKADSPCHCGIRNDSTTYIDCSQQNLMDVPEFMRSFLFDQLTLSDNFISTIQDISFANLRVRQIYFSGNPISSVSPGAFGQLSLLSNLEIIHVQFLKSVRQIPSSLLCRAGKLKVLNLEGLSVGSNPVIQICSNMTRLRVLRLSDCGIDGVPTLQLISSIVELDFSRNGIKRLPEILPLNLTILNASYNDIDQVVNMPSSLQVLDLSHNRLKGWTMKFICNVNSMHILNLDGNGITSLSLDLPKECAQQLAVRHLSMRLNRLTSVGPRSAMHKETGVMHRERVVFDGLATIDLSDNLLTHFDASGLDDIEILRLSKNELDTVPLNLPISLRVLDLSNNKICSISASSVKILSRLKMYILDNNPFFCDCNLVPLQTDIGRRESTMHSNNIQCYLPVNLRNVKLSAVRLKCVHEVPDCVKRAQGSYLQ